MRTSEAKIAPAAAAGESGSAESLGWQLRGALPPMRLHSVSLYDRNADVLWLSEGALGPDEHGFVCEAISTLSADSALIHCESNLQDGRGALFLAVRSPQGELVGLVMILADLKSLSAGAANRILTAPIRAVLQRIAILLRSQAVAKAANAAAAGNSNVAESRDSDALEFVPDTAEATMLTADTGGFAQPSSTGESLAPPSHSPEVLSPSAVDDLLEFELHDVPTIGSQQQSPTEPAAATSEAGLKTEPTSTKRSEIRASARKCDPTLSLRQFVRLRASGRTRRYEVVASAEGNPAGKGDAIPPEILVTELASWLAAHPLLPERDALNFLISVPAQALDEPRFVQLVASSLSKAAVAPASFGFQIPETLCISHKAQAERFIAACEKLGCFIVLADFTFNSAAVEFLRSRALRLVTVDAKLTATAMKDKLAQALVIAICQASKVLGVHCAAKGVESQMARRWLTAIGFDFAQGSLLAMPQSLDALAAPVESV